MSYSHHCEDHGPDMMAPGQAPYTCAEWDRLQNWMQGALEDDTGENNE